MLEITMDVPAGKLSHAEISRKFGVGSTYAYYLADRAVMAYGFLLVRRGADLSP